MNAKEVLARHWSFAGPVLDAKSEISISIRKNDVGSANQKDPQSCPTALACERAGMQVIVYASVVYVRVKDDRPHALYRDMVLRYFCSPELRREIQAWDQTSKFKPGVYVLRPPDKSARLGSKRRLAKGVRKIRSVPRKRRVLPNVRRYA